MYTSPEKEREKKTKITNLTHATVTIETNKIMTCVLTIRFLNFRLSLFNDMASLLCLLFLFFNPNDTVSILGFFYYFFTKRCRFLWLLLLFSLFNVNKGQFVRKERERERDGYGTSSDDGSDYWVIKNLDGY